MLQEQDSGVNGTPSFPQGTGPVSAMGLLKRLYSPGQVKPLKKREKSAFFLINSLYTYTRLSHPFARHVQTCV
ncbi:hypothetical protein AGR2A_Cc160135 [Agrobacterium genomosp. 2 str. CFBP 5494]|uniref:Uncharacterized protein n=1 Tax=Agrobacterium genomosp. 2 str. CFBP 5494 TaxID=1183436 RepID=A0A9W5B035_9HYPH|nr:hypothetical protein AGR2A_Cc160135 [Agrobacterium genomosp. 2 str. CFBP 5494]